MMIVIRHAAQLARIEYSALIHVLGDAIGNEFAEALANELCPNTIPVTVHCHNDQRSIHEYSKAQSIFLWRGTLERYDQSETLKSGADNATTVANLQASQGKRTSIRVQLDHTQACELH